MPWFALMYLGWGIAAIGTVLEWRRLRGAQQGQQPRAEQGLLLVRGDITGIRSDRLVPRAGHSAHATFGLLSPAALWFVRQGYGGIRLGAGLTGIVRISPGHARYEGRLGRGLAACLFGALLFLLASAAAAWPTSAVPATVALGGVVWVGVALWSERRASRLIAAEVLRAIDTAG